MLRVCYSIIFFFILLHSYSQNLIPNYSFELSSEKDCPKFLVEIDGGWEKIGGESFTRFIDTISHSLNFIHICRDRHYFNSYSGNAYIRYQMLTDYAIPQLFQVEMIETLIKGEEYLIEYYVRISARSTAATTNIDDICVFFLNNKYHFKASYNPSTDHISFKGNFKIKRDLFFFENRPINDFSEWSRVSNRYVAKGGEKYFLIGSFRKTKYYKEINLDDITVRKISNNTISIENTKVGDAIILENISFELNSSKLTESSYPTLNQLVEFFNIYPNLIIEIAGHTDNTGNNNANLKLSENRAKSVVDYLISAGVTPNRIQSKGYGESLPIADNTTEKGREKNRRVEFKILQR